MTNDTENEGEGAGAGLLVPLSAVASDPEGNSRVFTIDEESSSAVAVEVTTGRVVGDRVEVLEGLSVGSRVVTAGARFLRPGQKIKLLAGSNG